MLRHLGYVAKNFTIDAATGRTCRLANATPEKLRSVIAANLADLERIYAFNVEHGIGLFRLSSQAIPFASHEANTLAWWDEFAETFARLREASARHGLRVTMHPGQYNVLGSPSPKVVAASVAELEASARLLDAVHHDATGKMVVHIGGAYGDKAAALGRFESVVSGLSEPVRRRLVLENDDTVYTTAEALSLSDSTGLPVVFDWFHHALNPSDDPDHARLIARCFATWGEADGPPKVHLSSQSEGGRPGHHSDYLDPADLAAFLAHVPDRPFDLMVEAKQKDLALLRLRDQIAAGLPIPSTGPA